MRFTHTLLALLFAITCSAQVNVKLPNSGSIASQEWVKVYLADLLTRLKSTTDTTTVPTDPGSGDPCVGLALTSVYAVKSNELAFTFTGTAQVINWYILSGTTVVRNGAFATGAFTAYEIGFNTLSPGTYKFKITGLSCTTSTAIEFTILSDSPACTGGPTISSIGSPTRTGLTFFWSGVNVPSLIWNIRQNGATLRTGSSSSSSQSVGITFASLPYGTYELQLIGITCPTTSTSVSFTIIDNTPAPSNSGRHVYMNLTGYGFDINDATGLSSEWREKAEAFLNVTYQGNTFKGIDGIRVNIKWWEYEPNEGNFNDTKLIAAINWCIARGIRLSVALIPWRREGDNMFTDFDKVRLMDNRIWYMEGDLPTTYKTYQPSVNSSTARTKFKNTAKHMAQILKQYQNNVDYISTATAHTEEYQLIRQENPIMMTGYGDVDKSVWNTYSSGQSVPYPPQNNEDGFNSMMASSVGRTWYEFQTNGLKQFHAAFVQGVREGAGSSTYPRSCGMYAGVGAPSAVFDFTYKLNTIYSAGLADQPTIMYSSEGDAGSQGSKLLATDINAATFAGSETAIEFDSDDISYSQVRNPPWDADLSNDIFYSYSESFFRRGGKIVHFAMAFNPAKINQLAKALWDIKTKFLESSTGMTGIEQGTPITFPITRYYGLQEYRGMWSDNGGGLNKQVKITLQ